MQHGTSTIEFDYRIVAKRKGYGHDRLTGVEVREDTPLIEAKFGGNGESVSEKVQTFTTGIPKQLLCTENWKAGPTPPRDPASMSGRLLPRDPASKAVYFRTTSDKDSTA
jgi:hypothetical protein